MCPPGFKEFEKNSEYFSNLFFYLLLLTAPRVAAVQAERRPLPRAATMPQPILSRPIHHHLPNPTPRVPGAQAKLPFQSRDSPNRWQVGRLHLIFKLKACVTNRRRRMTFLATIETNNSWVSVLVYKIFGHPPPPSIISVNGDNIPGLG